MKDEKEKKINDLRSHFRELSKELEYLRGEWIEARNRHDLSRETELIGRETELFKQVNEIIKAYAELV
ncbi:MAG: hypothetical protein A4E57_04393 [Syntrophorhabdaceae bacterium PtaU1.Bin034]|nr:MAG: hypothetical protein A4E57_04393 [Syntrophorhabdaceae bacterium PtaU1.Bin034]